MGNVTCLWFIPEGAPIPFQISQSDIVPLELLRNFDVYDIHTTTGLHHEQIISRHITHTKAEKGSITDCPKCCSANSFLSVWLRHHCKEQLVPLLWLCIMAHSYKCTWIQWGLCARRVLAGAGIALSSCFRVPSNREEAIHPSSCPGLSHKAFSSEVHSEYITTS